MENVNLYIAFCGNSNTCSLDTMTSFLMLQKLLSEQDIKYNFGFQLNISNDPAFVKNAAISNFLANENYTHILFISDNIRFSPQDVIKLLNRNLDVVGAIGNSGNYYWQKLFSAPTPEKIVKYADIIKQAPNDAKSTIINKIASELRAEMLLYNIELFPEAKVNENGLLEVKSMTSDFLLCTRKVITSMTNYFAYRKMSNGNDPNPNLYNLFRFDVVEGKYLSDDFIFCKQLRECNLKIFADVSVNLTRCGNEKYDGNFILASGNSQDFGTRKTPETKPKEIITDEPIENAADNATENNSTTENNSSKMEQVD